MAELNLCVVANRVLGLLRSEEVRGSLWDSDMERLEETISALAPFLLDAEKKSLESDEVREWVVELGEAFYDVQNYLEATNMSYHEEAAALKRPSSSGSSAIGKSKTSSFVKKMVKKVRAMMIFSTSFPLKASPSFSYFSGSGYGMEYFMYRAGYKLKDQRDNFNLVELSEKEIQVRDEARKEVAAGSPLVDGWASIREKDKMAIVDYLLDVDQAFEVLPIVGEPEIGKTMIQSYVIKDERVLSHFDIRILWVDGPSSLESRWILETIVACSTRQERVHRLDMETLRRCVGDSLHDKRCLVMIVLDDVQFEDYEELNSIAQSLQNGAPGSRILLITRCSLVGDVAGAWREYRLECLSEEESWDLFKKMAFRQGQESITDSLLESIGKKIASSYKQHPHAIMAIGSMLSCEDYSEADRRLFCENELIPLLEKCKDNYPSIDPFLFLSYNHLPSPLKHCFAYCSLFPNNYEIDVKTLIKLWIAHGFVVPSLKTTRGKFDEDLESIGKSDDYTENSCEIDDDLEDGKSDEDLEDIGYEYFLYLLRRSFFQEAKLDARGRVTKCRMHHPVNKLASWASGNQCWASGNKDCSLSFGSIYDTVPSTVFHVSLAYTFVEQGDLSQWSSQSTLRSLLFPTRRGTRHDNLISHWDEIFSRYGLLRALDMHACGIKTVPYSIGKLKHLKYLDLSENEDLMELPDSVANLLNLQNLKLSSCFRLKKLPRDTGNLVNLRHLEIDGCNSLTSLPQGFGQLTNLRTLSQFVLSSNASEAVGELNELRQLRNLREVQIQNLRHIMGKQISTCLKDWQRLRSLLLEWESREPESDNNIAQLNGNLSSDLEELTLIGFRAISGLSFLPNSPTKLVKLSLKRLAKCKILPPLDQCFTLKVLVLDEMADLEYISENFSMQVCPSLQELWLTELPKLKSWWEETDGMALETHNLPSFPCLSRLVVEDCPNLVSMPLFPTLKEGLVLDSTSWELFQKTMNLKATVDEHTVSTSTSRHHSPPLSKLKNLCIVGIGKFDNSKAEEIPWDTLESLQMLKFDFLPEMTSLPEGLQLVTSLRELHIWRCGTKEIPEWIEKLKFLEKLVIRACPNMKLLPANTRSLKKLLTLEIEDCPTLLRRCEKETGADWDKIARIPIKRFGRISAK